MKISSAERRLLNIIFGIDPKAEFRSYEKAVWKTWKAFQKGKVNYTTYLDARMKLQLMAEDLATLYPRKEVTRRYNSPDDLYDVAESAVLAARAYALS